MVLKKYSHTHGVTEGDSHRGYEHNGWYLLIVNNGNETNGKQTFSEDVVDINALNTDSLVPKEIVEMMVE